MTETLKPGIHKISDTDYHADPAPDPSLSSTLARTILERSPLHAWTAHPRLNPDHEPEEKKTFDIGRAAHRAVLGAGGDYVEIPDDVLASNGAASTKAAKEFIAEVREAGKTPLKSDEIAQIEAMAMKVHDRLDQIKVWLDTDRSEMTALSQIDGAWCRAMIDNAPEDPSQPLWDFKTTVDASPAHCQRAVLNYGYDVQAAFYREVWRAATGEDRAFRFIFQEKTAPYEVCLIELDSEALTMAEKKTRRARDIWKKCLDSGHWPGYPQGVHVVALPAWHHERWLERESVEADFRNRTGRDILDAARRWQAPEPMTIAGE